jgi:hypothetical protein
MGFDLSLAVLGWATALYQLGLAMALRVAQTGWYRFIPCRRRIVGWLQGQSVNLTAYRPWLISEGLCTKLHLHTLQPHQILMLCNVLAVSYSYVSCHRRAPDAICSDMFYMKTVLG